MKRFCSWFLFSFLITTTLGYGYDIVSANRLPNGVFSFRFFVSKALAEARCQNICPKYDLDYAGVSRRNIMAPTWQCDCHREGLWQVLIEELALPRSCRGACREKGMEWTGATGTFEMLSLRSCACIDKDNKEQLSETQNIDYVK